MTSDHYTSVRSRTDDSPHSLIPTASLISDTHATRDAILARRHSNYTRSLIIAKHRHPRPSLSIYGRDHSYPHNRNSNPQAFSTLEPLVPLCILRGSSRNLVASPLLKWPPAHQHRHRCPRAVRLCHIDSLGCIHDCSYEITHTTNGICVDAYIECIMAVRVCDCIIE